MPRRKQRQSNMMESDLRWCSHYLVLGHVTQARHRCKTCDATAPSPGCSFPFHFPQSTSLSPAYKYQLRWSKWASPILKHNQNAKDQNQCLGKDSETGSSWSDSEGVPCVRCRAMSPHLWPGVPGHWPLDWGLAYLYPAYVSPELHTHKTKGLMGICFSLLKGHLFHWHLGHWIPPTPTRLSSVHLSKCYYLLPRCFPGVILDSSPTSN